MTDALFDSLTVSNVPRRADAAVQALRTVV